MNLILIIGISLICYIILGLIFIVSFYKTSWYDTIDKYSDWKIEGIHEFFICLTFWPLMLIVVSILLLKHFIERFIKFLNN